MCIIVYIKAFRENSEQKKIIHKLTNLLNQRPQAKYIALMNSSYKTEKHNKNCVK